MCVDTLIRIAGVNISDKGSNKLTYKFLALYLVYLVHNLNYDIIGIRNEAYIHGAMRKKYYLRALSCLLL
jgi:hypothetical protein